LVVSLVRGLSAAPGTMKYESMHFFLSMLLAGTVSVSKADSIPMVPEKDKRRLFELIERADYPAFEKFTPKMATFEFLDSTGISPLYAALGFTDVCTGDCFKPNRAKRAMDSLSGMNFSRKNIAKGLIKSGADPYFKNRDGLSTLDNAKLWKECGFIEFVMKHRPSPEADSLRAILGECRNAKVEIRKSDPAYPLVLKSIEAADYRAFKKSFNQVRAKDAQDSIGNSILHTALAYRSICGEPCFKPESAKV
jgi:hypothetical protein